MGGGVHASRFYAVTLPAWIATNILKNLKQTNYGLKGCWTCMYCDERLLWECDDDKKCGILKSVYSGWYKTRITFTFYLNINSCSIRVIYKCVCEFVNVGQKKNVKCFIHVGYIEGKALLICNTIVLYAQCGVDISL